MQIAKSEGIRDGTFPLVFSTYLTITSPVLNTKLGTPSIPHVDIVNIYFILYVYLYYINETHAVHTRVPGYNDMLMAYLGLCIPKYNIRGIFWF